MILGRLFIGLLLLSALACNSGNSGTTGSQAPAASQAPATSTPPAPIAATPASKATVGANPNPVPPGAGLGRTTVTWNTGDGSWAQVYLAVEGQPEVLFVEGRSGSKAAPWISAGPVYEFRVYAGKEHKTVLASVKVTRGAS